MERRIAFSRALVGLVAAGELAWSLLFYLRPDMALSMLGRDVVDPVIARQYPLYLGSVALAYGLAATNPLRYLGIVWICLAQRVVELGVAFLDWRAHAIATSPFLGLGALEIAVAIALMLAIRGVMLERSTDSLDPRDRGLVRLLRGFGGLEVFWFLASTVFVQLGSRLLNWKLEDPYTTQQQGIALLIIGLVCLFAASNISRYRVFVWVAIASQIIGVANSFNEIRLGSIGWGTAAAQWTIELAIVGAFVYFSRHRLHVAKPVRALAE